MTPKKPIASNLGSNEAQSTRFIEAARAAGASEDEAVFDANLKKIVKAKAEGSVLKAQIKRKTP